MPESIKFTDDRYLDTTGVWDRFFGAPQLDLNKKAHGKFQNASVYGVPILSVESWDGRSTTDASFTNPANFITTKLRYTSGCIGSVQFTSSSTPANGWYHFIWIPHRSGAAYGEANSDNCNYGCLLLFPLAAGSGTWYSATFFNGSNVEIFTHS